MDEDLKNVLHTVANWHRELVTCLDQTGNKYENDKQAVLERTASRMQDMLTYFADEES